jgi:hypothetical protein
VGGIGTRCEAGFFVDGDFVQTKAWCLCRLRVGGKLLRVELGRTGGMVPISQSRSWE